MIARHLTLALLAVALGCTRESDPSSAAAPSPTPADVTSVSASASAEAPSSVPASSLGTGLDEALTRGVVAPAEGGTSYRIDPFVAALVVSSSEREAARWFERFSGKPPKVDYEVTGWRVTGPAERAGLMRLGLREGDIVEHVNGVPAVDADAVRRALAGSDEGVTVGVFREDYSFVLGYRFEHGLAWSRTLEDLGTPGPAGDDGGGEVAAGDDAPAGDDATPTPDPEEPIAAADDGPRTPSSSGSASGGRSTGVGSSKPSTPTTPKDPGTKPSSGSSPVACTSDTECTMKRSYFDSMTSSPSKIESQAKIVPAVRDDVFSGYKLSWVRPGSAVADLGFKSGDKITHVNGRDLTDDAQAFALYLSLSSTSTYKVRYVRGNSTRTKTILVK